MPIAAGWVKGSPPPAPWSADAAHAAGLTYTEKVLFLYKASQGVYK